MALRTPLDTAKKLDVSERTLARDRERGRGLPFIRLGPKLIRYDDDDIDAYLAANTHNSRAEELASQSQRKSVFCNDRYKEEDHKHTRRAPAIVTKDAS